MENHIKEKGKGEEREDTIETKLVKTFWKSIQPRTGQRKSVHKLYIVHALNVHTVDVFMSPFTFFFNRKLKHIWPSKSDL